MEIIYTVDLQIPNKGIDLKQILKLDISSLNILAYSCIYLPISNQLIHCPHLISSSLHQTDKSSFCVYICSLEQPWFSNLIHKSIVPISQLVWNLDGTYLLICDQTGLCQIFQIKNACINTMDKIYEYRINEDIICAKCLLPRQSIIVDLERNQSIFFKEDIEQPSQLKYALSASNFICITTSGIIHTLPINRSQSAFAYSLSKIELLTITLCYIHPTLEGFHVILSEDSLVRFFVVHYDSFEPKLTYLSCQSQSFRIPSSSGQLQSLIYFQQNGIDCILIVLKTLTGDSIELYRYSIENRKWLPTNSFRSHQSSITSLSFSPNEFIVESDHYQGLFGRQILITLNDGSIAYLDKFDIQSHKQYFMLNHGNYFMQIKHTYSGSCCLGFTHDGTLVLFRTVSLHRIATLPSITNLFIHFFEQYISQTSSLFDIWDVFTLLPNENFINNLIDRLVFNYMNQSIEFQRQYFLSFKRCLYYFHRLLNPFDKCQCQHLTSLLIYSILLIIRNYLRLFIYEPTNRYLVDVIQEILQQKSFHQIIDCKQIKYLDEQQQSNINNSYESIYFIRLIDWITDLIFYLIDFHQSESIITDEFFRNTCQLQWLRELLLGFYILNQMRKIPQTKIAHIHWYIRQRDTTKDLLRDIYHNLADGLFNQNYSIINIDKLQSKRDEIFPRFYRFLLPNSHSHQIFIRDHPPYIDYNSQINPNHQFDILIIGKLSLVSNPIFRRCVRCSNYSRIFSNPILVNQLNHRCICGGLFLVFKVR